MVAAAAEQSFGETGAAVGHFKTDGQTVSTQFGDLQVTGVQPGRHGKRAQGGGIALEVKVGLGPAEPNVFRQAESGKGGAAAVAAAAAAPQGIRVLEGLSATGLRAVRYAKEIPGIREVVANDFSKGAVESIERNIAHNKVGDKVTASHGDAALVMYQNREPASARFDVIDLDPYGTAAPFLDAAVQAVQDGGLLAVTCTDLAVLCGNHSEACHAKYGSTSLRGKHCHEFALRIVLSSQKSSRLCNMIVNILECAT